MDKPRFSRGFFFYLPWPTVGLLGVCAYLAGTNLRITSIPINIGGMKKVWLHLGITLIVGVAAFAWWSTSRREQPPTPPEMETPGGSADLSYPQDPAKLRQWLRETHYELVYNDASRAERWAPLLKKYCRQGCADCCGLYAVALQNLDHWDAAEEAAAGCAAPESPYCLFAMARIYSHHQNDDRQALPFYEQACTAGLTLGCTNAGVSLALGRQMIKNPQRAAAYYRQACEAGEPIACTNLGILLESKEIGPPDPAQAAALYRRSCSNRFSYTRGCVNLGVLLLTGSGIAPDEAGALPLFSKACERQDGRGCHYLALLHAEGRGTPRNEMKAAEFRAKACKQGYQEDCGK